MVEEEERKSNGGSHQTYGSINADSQSIKCVNAAYEGPHSDPKIRDGIEWPGGQWKAIYVIFLLTLLNAANKMDRYVLIEVIKEMADDLEFGDRSCLNATVYIDPTDSVEEREKYKCDPQRCEETEIVSLNDTASNVTSCHWVYWGTGLEYQLLAGPAFIVVVGLMRIPLTFAMEHGRINGRNILVACSIAWSLATLLTGFATEVWHVYVCRVLLGLFQAPFSPFSVALVTAYSPPQLRGLAMSILNSGIAVGYALAYGLGFLKEVAGWRWAYWVAGIPGVVVAILMLFTLQNPAKLIQKQTSQSMIKMGRCEQLIFQNWATIIPLSLGSALRFGATYIFNYNINNYLLHYYPHFHVHNYLSWTPILSGFGGILFGGILSDVARRRYGLEGRMCTQIALSVICAPVMTLIFFLEPPAVFAAAAVGTSIADAWTGGTVSTLTELIPPGLRPSFFAVYYCLINTVGGTLNITLPALRQAMRFRYAMIMAVIGLISLGTVLFTLGLFAMACSRRRYGDSKNQDEIEDQNANETITPILS
ncbi:D-galactonate transporter-like [Lytechinus variegatus]|uniref:D-galactonate transporter-like n=1 Tax=Lytechinus variegatus TaxID=7654 RepID=UPI001BB12E66|nr:D-galactonate transporter-like [Lytechinus variegatus]